LSVSVYGTLTSHTEAEIDADTALNLIALGDVGRWEYLQFATATLTGTSGTANTLHAHRLEARPPRDRGQRRQPRRATSCSCCPARSREVGTDECRRRADVQGSDARARRELGDRDQRVFAGDTLKPYAPAAVKWAYDGTDLTGTITRRTRVGGNWERRLDDCAGRDERSL
jgi:hypothetical protein